MNDWIVITRVASFYLFYRVDGFVDFQPYTEHLSKIQCVKLRREGW